VQSAIPALPRRIAVIQKFVVTLFAILVLSAAAVGEVRDRWAEPLRIPEQGFTLIVSQGDSLRSVAATLKAAGVLVHPKLVTLYGRWTGVDQQIKPGEYQLAPGTTAALMLVLLQRGDTVKYQVTLPEGITLATALTILSQEEKLERVVTGPDDNRLLQLIAPFRQPEGLFFPDTYQYMRGDTDFDILQNAHRAMQEVLNEEWSKRALNLPYATPYEALTMASIIEKETGLPEERKQISGVFVRRLQKGMLLQTDPTVIYGLGLEFDGNLKREHLAEKANSYNTYRRPGLPPTPIALPGRAAINAALHPDNDDSLYFVARGDGSHVFSSTLKAHSHAVREYQLNRKKANSSETEPSP
jgi:UPF0755 protein